MKQCPDVLDDAVIRMKWHISETNTLALELEKRITPEERTRLEAMFRWVMDSMMADEAGVTAGV